MAQDNSKVKKELAVIQSFSLRQLVEKVNSINSSEEGPYILKDDIVKLVKENDSFILLYYK